MATLNAPLSEAHYPPLNSPETWLCFTLNTLLPGGGWLQHFAWQKLPSPCLSHHFLSPLCGHPLPPVFLSDSPSPAPRWLPRRSVVWLICLCDPPVITTLKRQASHEWYGRVFTHWETISRIMNHTQAWNADNNNNSSNNTKLYGNEKLFESESQ